MPKIIIITYISGSMRWLKYELSALDIIAAEFDSIDEFMVVYSWEDGGEA